MATKKRRTAKREGPKGNTAQRRAKGSDREEPEKPDMTDQQIFDIFGVGTETASQPLRKFISGQRVINGHLYTAIDKILYHLKVTQGKAGDPDLEEAGKRSDAVPDVPPACNRGGGNG